MSELGQSLTAALAGSYAIEREIGRGGSATVFLAKELKHGRMVALKVLHPELAASLAADRFLREIRIASRLQHPHILPVHDSGEVAGALYYTTPDSTADADRAWASLAELESLTPEKDRAFSRAMGLAFVAVALGRAGLSDSAHRVLHGVRTADIPDPHDELLGWQAMALTRLGDYDQAISLLEQYLAKRPDRRPGFVNSRNGWWWRELRDKPRFIALVHAR